MPHADIIAYAALGFGLVPALCAFFNAFRFRPPQKPPLDWSSEPISVLIPARDEEHNIAESICSALANISSKGEVIVLDDGSADNTAAIVRQFAQSDPRVRLVLGKPLPEGCVGKLHACHQLSEAATKPLLLLVDADVRLEPGAARRIAFHLDQGGSALASGFPRQVTGSFVEKLLIPLIYFVLLGFLSIKRMRRSKDPAYGTACGQLMLARADAYHACGGHGAVLDSIHDGLDVPRTFRRGGHLTDLCDITELAQCRMYTNGRDTIAGLEKNATRGMATPRLIFPITLLLGVGQILPFLLLAAAPWVGLSIAGLAAVAASLALIFAQRFSQCEIYRCSWAGALLHPLGIAVLLAIQWAALLRKLLGFRPKWKGRALPT